jgi:adenylate cyclase
MKQQEIEFRFKMDEKYFNEHIKNKIQPIEIQQCYIQLKDKEHTRLRIETFPSGKKRATITTKTGEKPSRLEFESEIDVDQALIMFKSSKFKLEKKRYILKQEGFKWEIDFFEKEKILMVEIELPALDAPFPHPLWLKENVTFNKKYSNISIAKRKKR